MDRRGLVVLSLFLAAAADAAGGIATNRYTISHREKDRRHEEFLAVSRGRLTLGGSTFGSVSDNLDAADRWFILGTRIKSSVGGGYLAYDPAGKEDQVFLVARPGEGTEWSVSVVGGREGQRGVIRAATGPMKGWYLDVEDRADKATDGKGKAVVLRLFVLRKTPSHRLEAERIYSHK
jgi:hypothetical protein